MTGWPTPEPPPTQWAVMPGGRCPCRRGGTGAGCSRPGRRGPTRTGHDGLPGGAAVERRGRRRHVHRAGLRGDVEDDVALGDAPVLGPEGPAQGAVQLLAGVPALRLGRVHRLQRGQRGHRAGPVRPLPQPPAGPGLQRARHGDLRIHSGAGVDLPVEQLQREGPADRTGAVPPGRGGAGSRTAGARRRGRRST